MRAASRGRRCTRRAATDLDDATGADAATAVETVRAGFRARRRWRPWRHPPLAVLCCDDVACSREHHHAVRVGRTRRARKRQRGEQGRPKVRPPDAPAACMALLTHLVYRGHVRLGGPSTGRVRAACGVWRAHGARASRGRARAGIPPFAARRESRAPHRVRACSAANDRICGAHPLGLAREAPRARRRRRRRCARARRRAVPPPLRRTRKHRETLRCAPWIVPLQ